MDQELQDVIDQLSGANGVELLIRNDMILEDKMKEAIDFFSQTRWLFVYNQHLKVDLGFFV